MENTDINSVILKRKKRKSHKDYSTGLPILQFKDTTNQF